MELTGCEMERTLLKKTAVHLELGKPPSMGSIFLKAFLLSFLKPSGVLSQKGVSGVKIRLRRVKLEKKRIALFKRVCGCPDNGNDVPLLYPQLLFLGLMGRLVTHARFPLNPLGLIHTGQTAVLHRPIEFDESLDLTCCFTGIRVLEKGVEMDCLLGAADDKALVWEGVTTFLSRRSRAGKQLKKIHRTDATLPARECIIVPEKVGKHYAGVSGDYNPIHLSGGTARLLGFNRPIAHGMWSLARCLAGIEKRISFDGPVRLEASFKRPVFIPAKISLGYDEISDSIKRGRTVTFELRDLEEGTPHVLGTVKNYF